MKRAGRAFSIEFKRCVVKEFLDGRSSQAQLHHSGGCMKSLMQLSKARGSLHLRADLPCGHIVTVSSLA